MRAAPARMSSDPKTVMVSITDYLDAGLVLGLAATRTLALYRAAGGRIATSEWLELWRARRAARGL